MSRAFGTPSTVTRNNPDFSCVALNDSRKRRTSGTTLRVLLCPEVSLVPSFTRSPHFPTLLLERSYPEILSCLPSPEGSHTVVLLPFKPPRLDQKVPYTTRRGAVGREFPGPSYTAQPELFLLQNQIDHALFTYMSL